MPLAVEARLRGEVFPRFGVSLGDDDWAGAWLAPDWIDLRDDPGRRRQVAQHLQDLGFLDGETGPPGDDLLRAGLLGFYAEAGSFYSSFEEAGTAQDLEGTPRLPPDPVVRTALVEPLKVTFSRLRQLQALTALDGSLRLLQAPVPGERSLPSRVARYRLRTFNFLERKTGAEGAWDEAAQAGLEQFLGLLFPAGERPSAVAGLNLLGSALALVRRFQARQGDHPLVAPVAGEKGPPLAAHFRNAGPGYARGPGNRRLEAQARDPVNLFGLELLQVLLWMDGYYEGAIDLDWGPRSQEALEAAIDQEALERTRLVRRRRGYWYLDHRYGMERLLELATDGPAEAIYAQQDRVLAAFDQALAASTEVQNWQDLEAQVDQRSAFLAERPERRQYFGLGALVRAVRKLAGWIRESVDRLASWLHRLAGPVLQFVRFLGRGLRRSLGYAGLALRRLFYWVTGRPFFTVQEEPPACLLSKPDLDGDLLNFVIGPAGPETTRRHGLLMRRMNRALGVVLAVAVDVFQAAATGPIGWFPLGVAIFRLVRDHLEAARADGLTGAMLWS